MRAAVIPRIHNTTKCMNRDFSMVSQYPVLRIMHQSVNESNQSMWRARAPCGGRARRRGRARETTHSHPPCSCRRIRLARVSGLGSSSRAVLITGIRPYARYHAHKSGHNARRWCGHTCVVYAINPGIHAPPSEQAAAAAEKAAAEQAAAEHKALCPLSHPRTRAHEYQ